MTTEQHSPIFAAHTPPDMPWLDMYEPEVPRDFAPPDLTLHGLFEKIAAEYPGNIATIFFGARLTYAQIDDQANGFASALQSLGVRPGDRVAIILPNCPQFLVALFGALKAGAVAVPLNPAYVPRELAVQFADAGVETVVTLNTNASRVQEAVPDTPVKRLIVTQIQNYLTPLMGLMLSAQERRAATGQLIPGEGVHVLGDLIRNAAPEYERPGTSPDDPALLLYTGGTTGTPKGATLSHRNLVSNALQHTPATARITVRIGTRDDDAVIEVIDEGPGMAREDAERVFERFYRADSSRTRASGGTGLGLSIVDSLVGAHGGTVTVTTAPGQGCRFVVTLPRVADVAAQVN